MAAIVYPFPVNTPSATLDRSRFERLVREEDLLLVSPLAPSSPERFWAKVGSVVASRAARQQAT